MAVALFCSAWTRWRRPGRKYPARTDIDPAAIGALLPYVFIVQCEAPLRFRMRLAGEAVLHLYGRGLIGQVLDEGLPPPLGNFASDRSAQVVSEGRGLWSSGTVHLLSGRTMPTDRVILPLAEHDGQIDHLIGLIHHPADGFPSSPWAGEVIRSAWLKLPAPDQDWFELPSLEVEPPVEVRAPERRRRVPRLQLAPDQAIATVVTG